MSRVFIVKLKSAEAVVIPGKEGPRQTKCASKLQAVLPWRPLLFRRECKEFYLKVDNSGS